MKIDFKKMKKVVIPAVIVVVLLAVAWALYYFAQKNKNTISQDEAATKTIEFINTKLLNGQATAELIESSTDKEYGLYKIKFKVQDQEFTFYGTRDGKLLFPQVIPMAEEKSNSDQAAGTTSTETPDVPKKDKSQALLFVMSYCPYGNQAEEIMMPVVNLLKDKADVQLHYVIYEKYNGGGPNYCLDKDSKYCSMHGIQELNQDVRELCVQKYQKDKFWSFIKEANAKCTSKNVDSCWEGAATAAGVDVAKVKTCQKNEAVTLLEQEVKLGEKYGISGSPQLVINDKEYEGTRSAEAFKSAICAGFNTAPSECSQTLQSTTSAPASGGCE